MFSGQCVIYRRLFVPVLCAPKTRVSVCFIHSVACDYRTGEIILLFRLFISTRSQTFFMFYLSFSPSSWIVIKPLPFTGHHRLAAQVPAVLDGRGRARARRAPVAASRGRAHETDRRGRARCRRRDRKGRGGRSGGFIILVRFNFRFLNCRHRCRRLVVRLVRVGL